MPRSYVSRTLVCALCTFSVAPLVLAQELSEFLDCSGAAAESILCQEHQEAIDARARAEASLDELKTARQLSDSQEIFDDASRLYDKAVNYFDNGYYGDAAATFEQVTNTVELLAYETDAKIESLKAQGDALIQSNNYAQAAEIFAQLQQLEPDALEHGEKLVLAQRGMKATIELQIIRDLVDAAAHGDAEQRIKNFPQGIWQAEIVQLSARVQALKTDARFNREMNEGFRQVEQKKWHAANRAFKNALALKPDSQLARESLKDSENRLVNEKLVESRSQYERQFETEDFQSAKATLLRMLMLASDKIQIESELESIDEIISYEDTLDHWLFLAQTRLNRENREGVRTFLGFSPDPMFGERIAGKWNDLNLRFAEQTTLYEIELVSDNATEVVIQPGRKLGKFNTTTLQVYPGDYRLTGTRKGFHQVVRTIEIPNDISSDAIEIICRDRF